MGEATSYRPCAGCDSVGDSCRAVGCPAVATLAAPAVPDPTVEALSVQSMLDDYARAYQGAQMGLDNNMSSIAHAIIERVPAILAARAAAPDALRVRIEALAAEFGECWVTRSEVRCTGFIGGTFKNGGEWVEAMCCLPCRVRALLEDGAQ